MVAVLKINLEEYVKKSYYKQCNIHRQEYSELYCYISNKIIYTYGRSK